MKNKWSGERLEAFIYGRDSIEHLHRYAMVMPYIENKTILDIACGEGYGSNLMSSKATLVHSVDIDPQTIQAAKAKYKKDNIRFQVGSATQIPLEDQSVDVVVSFETIEHHDQHEAMMREIKRVLKPNGVVIISTPDKLYYSDQRNFQNPFHVLELYKQEFVDLLSASFSNTQLLAQTYCNGNSIIQDDLQQANLSFFTGDYAKVQPQNIDALYLIIIGSDVDFQKQKLSIFNGEIIQKKSWTDHWQKSNTYRVGNFILKPLKILKRKSK
ncbi:methyltransferase domain-containing protein [Flavobacterium sp. CYK-55]|uniref:class I SAM-dependent methyltransferase n=1 Tax=Flavobacterium sp. CYK-55 TaxID=2835529 RepID=UPI001BCFF09E|nr:class I SAM-dependent methyltransferase [Flavobacterium sp. CYK-55]MBS7786411.1 methyltransferase domain-containing protein [Flavobacterium sp. CYK-55]